MFKPTKAYIPTWNYWKVVKYHKMAPIINTQDGRATKILDAAGIKYNLVEPVIQPIQRFVGSEYVLLEANPERGYSIDMLMPFERTHCGERHTDCSTPFLLDKESGCMPNGGMQVDFLKLIKSGKAFDGNGKRISSTRLNALYDEITGVRIPSRAEWIDATFGDGIISYHLIEEDGRVRHVTESLGVCLMEDKTPGISLDSWLKTADKHGLPTNKTEDGNLMFQHPINGRVAVFCACSDGAGLGCIVDPADSDAAIGVRVAKRRK